MKIIPAWFLALPLAVLSGCIEHPSTSTTEAEVEVSMSTPGLYCSHMSTGASSCLLCVGVRQPDGSLDIRCDEYICDEATGGCIKIDEWWPFSSFDEDFNVWFEAEDATLFAPMQKQADLGASNGVGTLVPATAGAGGYLRYHFDLPRPMTVYPWARVQTPSTASDSFLIGIDGAPPVAWQAPVTGTRYQWTALRDGATGAPKGFILPAGAHTVRIYRGESGARLDRVLLTGSAQFIPSTEVYEGESAGITPPMRTVAAQPFVTPGYVWVPNGAGTGGRATFNVSVPVAGGYAVWGRVNAPTGNDDSFYLSANFGAGWTWSIPNTPATGWAWRKGIDPGASSPFVFHLDGTDDFIQLAQREDGTKLDKLIVTNDPGHVPVDVTPVVTQ